MYNIEENKDITIFTTFGIPTKCRWYIKINSEDDVFSFIKDDQWKGIPKLILGGGSNILFTKDFSGVILHNEIKGIEKIHEDKDYVWIKVGGGEIWHDLVMYAIENNWGGIENLSLIPGSVGAAPMQNIGAYGVEVKDVIDSVEAIHMVDGSLKKFSNAECQFGYRESIFKRELKNQYFIISVVFRLTKNHDFKISYGAIKEELAKNPNEELNIRKISNAVIAIRQSKLPDPKEIGNAGSFFKNPEIEKKQADDLLLKFPEMVIYPINDKKVKVAAGWLIENCGWKGFQENNFGVHKKQALVLVNYGNSKGQDIFDLSDKIMQSVFIKFSIKLEREVNIY